MGAMLARPLTTKNVQTLTTASFQCATAEMNGWRSSMEDAHSLLVLDNKTEAMFVGVFDGHNGADCSVFAARNMETVLKTEPRPISEERITQIVCEIDRKFINADGHDGSTGVFAIISPENGWSVQVANIGDSRCLQGNVTTKQCIALSEDHKPTGAKERARIEAAGGCVSQGRVNGDLAVSRAFGDVQFKAPNLPPERQAVTVCPDFAYSTLNEGDFLLVACDGVFEANFSNDNVIAFAASQLAEHGDVALACCRVVDYAMRLGSRDNISCTIVWRKPTPGAQGEERQFTIPGSYLPCPTNDQYREAFSKMCTRGGITPAQCVMLRHDMLRAALDQTPSDPTWPSPWVVIKETLSHDEAVAELTELGRPPPDATGLARLQYFEGVAASRKK
eukprot:PhF_6_TR29010/c0_g1_i1/m.42264/K14803/PTC2_3; protein phosphatase PTC2/3